MSDDKVGKIELGHNQTVVDEDAWFEEQFKKRWPFVYMGMLDRLQALCEIGSRTHGNGDWRKRKEQREAAHHFMDHVYDWDCRGIDIDGGSGKSILDHILFNLQELIYNEDQERKGEK